MKRPTTLGTTGRIAWGAAAALLLGAAGAGVGLAIAGDHSESTMTMASSSSSTPTSTAKGAHKHAGAAKAGKADQQHVDWAHKYGQDHSAIPNLPDVNSASPEQRQAALDLLTQTEQDTAKYSDLGTAKAAGYDLQASLTRAESKKPHLKDAIAAVDAGKMPKKMPMLHVANKAFRKDGKVLDPNAPETLMYEYTGHGTWKLIGVMYTANESYPAAPPDPGGPIMRWHYHTKNGPGASLMMHIFFVPGNDLAKAYALEEKMA